MQKRNPPKVAKRNSRRLARLTRGDIADVVGRGAGLLSREVAVALDVVVDELVETLSVGGEVQIAGFGTIRGFRSGHGVRFQVLVGAELKAELNREEFLALWDQLKTPNVLVDFKKEEE